VKKLCVSEPFTDDHKQELAGFIEARLHDTQPPPGRKRLADPRNHSTSVEFRLGQAGLDLDVDSIDVSIADLEGGHTKLLFERLDQAREVAVKLLGPKPESKKVENV
jgi:hypothetical protein